MSGATLAAGPRMAKERKGRLSAVDENVSDFGGLGGVMGSFRVIELQLMAFIVVFSASGLVPLIDILFPVVISIYAVVIGKLVFPRYKNAELSVFKGNRVFQAYVIFGTLVGLFLPLAYVLGGFARNDQEAVRAATPHLFLLSCQVLSENLVSGLQIFSLPVRALMPLMYNTRRLFALVDWTEEMWITRHLSAHPTMNEEAWLRFGQGLAAVNTIYYTINLFGFLIPMFLPRAFERYFESRAAYMEEKARMKAEAEAEAERKKAEEIERKSRLPTPARPPGMEDYDAGDKKGQ
jgi:signal transduction histidine kinase